MLSRGELLMNQPNHSLPGVHPPGGPQHFMSQVTSTTSSTMGSINNQQVQFTNVPNSSMTSMSLNQQQVAPGPNSGSAPGTTTQVSVPCSVPNANMSPVSSSTMPGVPRPPPPGGQQQAPPPPYTTTSSTLADNMISVTSSGGIVTMPSAPMSSNSTSMNTSQSTSINSLTNNTNNSSSNNNTVMSTKENSFPPVSQTQTITTSANSENHVVPTSILNTQSSISNHTSIIPPNEIKQEGKPFGNQIKTEPMDIDNIKQEVMDTSENTSEQPMPPIKEIKEEPKEEPLSNAPEESVTVKEENVSVKEENVSVKMETSTSEGDTSTTTTTTPVTSTAESTGKGDKPQTGSKAKPSPKPVTSKPSTPTPTPPTPVGFKKDKQPLFKPDELRQHLLPTLDKLFKQDPESIPFRQPVDPNALGIPDYFEIIKKPMDMSTIKRKLDTGQYVDPWDYVDDVWLMFDNAWVYNRKTSRVYRYCTKVRYHYLFCLFTFYSVVYFLLNEEKY